MWSLNLLCLRRTVSDKFLLSYIIYFTSPVLIPYWGCTCESPHGRLLGFPLLTMNKLLIFNTGLSDEDRWLCCKDICKINMVYGLYVFIPTPSAAHTLP